MARLPVIAYRDLIRERYLLRSVNNYEIKCVASRHELRRSE
jgi:hypothetical protein